MRRVKRKPRRKPKPPRPLTPAQIIAAEEAYFLKCFRMLNPQTRKVFQLVIAAIAEGYTPVSIAIHPGSQ